MKLIRYNYPEVTDLFGDFDRFFRHSLRDFPSLGRLSPFFGPSEGSLGAPRLAADLYEDDENYYTRVELPGAKRKDVKVELEDSTLTITYEHKSEGDDESEAVELDACELLPRGIVVAYHDGEAIDG